MPKKAKQSMVLSFRLPILSMAMILSLLQVILMRVIISNNGVHAFFVVNHATPLTFTSSSSSLCLRSSPSTTTTTTTTTTAAAAGISNWTATIPTDTSSAVAVTNSSSNSHSNSNSNSYKRSFWNNLESILFPSINEDDMKKKKQEDDHPDLILAHWENVWEEDDAHQEQEELATEIAIESARLSSSTPSSMISSTTSSMTSIESLTNFLEVWSRISLQNDKGLTTPVTSSKFKISNDDNNNNNDENIIMMTMKLIFRPPKRYLSYKEQKSMEKNGAIPDRKNAKVDAWSPGGVQIEIITNKNKLQQQQKQQPRTNTSANKIKNTRSSSNIGIILRRCDIDGDTVIKRTTERAIIRRLDDAIRIWKKNN